MRTRANGMAFAPYIFMAATINTEISARLKEIARLLDEQGANQFRVRAYRRAAETLENLKRPVDKLIKTGGLEALQKLPGIGSGLARSVEQFVLTGRLSALDRLRGETDPIATLASVPGIGARLAERLHSELGITTLHGSLLQHGAGSRTGEDPRLGSVILRQRRWGDTMHGSHGESRATRRKPCSSRAGDRKRRLLQFREKCSDRRR